MQSTLLEELNIACKCMGLRAGTADLSKVSVGRFMPAHGRRPTGEQLLSLRCGIGCMQRGWRCASLRVQTLRKDALFFQTPAYLLHKERRAARGLPAMSSLLGVVRKQLKSHPAVSDRPGRFRPCGAVTLKALRRTRLRYWSHQKPSNVSSSDTIFLTIFAFCAVRPHRLGGIYRKEQHLNYCFHSKFLNIVLRSGIKRTEGDKCI